MPVVLSVGQCSYDDSRIGQVVRNALGAILERATSPEDAQKKIAGKKYDLVLVNRVFDAGTGMGIDFINDVKRDNPNAPPLMLVSDYADAQAAAIANGAAPGFGKSAIASPDVVETLRAAVKPVAPAE